MTWARNPKANTFELPKGYADIGWQLQPGMRPEYDKCHEAKHQRREYDNSLYLFRCTDVVTICDECKIVWHTDMSD